MTKIINGLEYTGTGTTEDPITFDAMKSATADPADVTIAGLAKTARAHVAAFSSKADLSNSLPADVRTMVNDAGSAITSVLTTASSARVKADSFLRDITLYPQGREMLAGEAIRAAADKVAELLAQAETQIDVAAAMTYEAARPRISADEAMPARADLQMMTQRSIGNPGELIATVRRLSQRGDAVGALVADQRFLGDFLDAQGIEPDMRVTIMTVIGSEVVQAAAKSGDPKRSAAARTSLALTELRKARVAAASFSHHMLQG
ncbi:hypothetical protein ACFQ7I_04065 [Streptomyces massasporeus]